MAFKDDTMVESIHKHWQIIYENQSDTLLYTTSCNESVGSYELDLRLSSTRLQGATKKCQKLIPFHCQHVVDLTKLRLRLSSSNDEAQNADVAGPAACGAPATPLHSSVLLPQPASMSVTCLNPRLHCHLKQQHRVPADRRMNTLSPKP